jgi:hypothetical protein
MGVGCDEAGVCYAEAHGQHSMCPNAVPAPTERVAEAEETPLDRAKRRQAARDASGDVHIEGSIYEGMEASLCRSGRTIAHVARYADAVEIARALAASTKDQNDDG